MSFLRLMEENMEQKEEASFPEDPSFKHPMHEKKRGLIALIREMWPAYLIEILVIIIGITITLALEEWRDAGKEKHLESLYLKNLNSDITTDLSSLKAAINGTQALLLSGNTILNAVRDSTMSKISQDLLNRDVRSILGRPKFIPNDPSFTDLKSSGNLHLIQNIQLKNLLFSYYAQTQVIKETQDAEQEATIFLSGSYFLKHFSLEEPSSRSAYINDQLLSELQKNIEFRNNVLLRVSNRTELLTDYLKADSLAGLLKTELEKEIE